MSILKIAKIGHPVLFKEADTVNSISKAEIKTLVMDMSETLLDANGIGLAAPQVYVSKKIIIFRLDEESQMNNKVKIRVLVNPSFKNKGKEYEEDWEGCLSIPGMIGKVKRFKNIIYQGYDLKGRLIKEDASGIQARVIQHECDHLNGILYTSKLVDPKYFGFADEIRNSIKNEKE